MSRIYRDRALIKRLFVLQRLGYYQRILFNNTKPCKYLLIKHTKELLKTARKQKKHCLHVTYS